MRRAARQDKNHAQIRAAFIRLGWTWRDTHQLGADFPDGVAGKFGFNVLVEIKQEKGKLLPGQVNFRDAWRGWVETCRTVDDVIKINETTWRGLKQ